MYGFTRSHRDQYPNPLLYCHLMLGLSMFPVCDPVDPCFQSAGDPRNSVGIFENSGVRPGPAASTSGRLKQRVDRLRADQHSKQGVPRVAKWGSNQNSESTHRAEHFPPWRLPCAHRMARACCHKVNLQLPLKRTDAWRPKGWCSSKSRVNCRSKGLQPSLLLVAMPGAPSIVKGCNQ